MAKKRDVVVGIIIAGSFLVVLFFFAIMMLGMMSGGGDASFAGFGQRVGVIEISGVLTEGSGRPVVELLEDWTDNSGIKAIVLHVNSPGGEVAISQEIYDAVVRARESKPVVVSMAAIAASGGYYVSCGADRIMANPGTLVGSIGVIMQFSTFGGLMDKVGMSMETVKSGELKDVGNISREMTDKEELMLQSVVMDTYEQFVGVVAEGRGMEKEEVYPLADGSVFTGLQAYNHGLVDSLGGLREAIGLAADLAGIEGMPDIVRPRRESRSIWGGLFESFLGDLGHAVEKSISGPRLLYLYQ